MGLAANGAWLLLRGCAFLGMGNGHPLGLHGVLPDYAAVPIPMDSARWHPFASSHPRTLACPHGWNAATIGLYVLLPLTSTPARGCPSPTGYADRHLRQVAANTGRAEPDCRQAGVGLGPAGNRFPPAARAVHPVRREAGLPTVGGRDALTTLRTRQKAGRVPALWGTPEQVQGGPPKKAGTLPLQPQHGHFPPGGAV